MRRKFKPKRGQIDFTRARWAPVVNIVLQYRGKILIVKRSKKLGFYPGYWNGIGGFLDDRKGLKKKVREELKEELGLKQRNIVSIRLGEIFDVDDPKLKKTWVIHPVLATVKNDKIRLDWEAEEYRWVRLEEIKKIKVVRDFRMVLQKLFQMR